MTLSSAPAKEDPAYRSAVKKFFRRMMPLVVFMLVINQMDRTNVGFVRTHLETDLGIGAAAYGFGAGLFFIGYALFEVPSNVFLEKFGARVWLTRIMITWGAVVVATAFTTLGYFEQTTGSTTGGLYGLSMVSLIAALTVFLVRGRAPAATPITTPAVR